MALYIVTTGKVTLTGGSTKSLALLNPVTNAFKVRQIDISLDASTASTGVQFDLYRVATIGTPAGTTTTAVLADERDTAATTTSLTTLTAEPTTVTVLASWYVQPLGGLVVIPFPYGGEPIGKGAGNRIGIRYVTPASVTPDCLLNVWFEE
jgi:hypothetical protein